MATFAEILGPEPAKKPTFESILGPEPTMPQTILEPPPFDIDKYVNESASGQPYGLDAQTHEEWVQTLGSFAKPWLKIGYTAPAAVNRGLAHLVTNLDAIAQWAAHKTGTEPGGLFKSLGDEYNKSADWWKARADAVGPDFLNELIGEALGGAVPGMTEFAMGIPYAAVLGAAKADLAGESDFIGALTEGGKRGILGGIFHAVAPLKQYLSVPAMFGVGVAQAKGEGASWQESVKSGGALALYGLGSPGGDMGLREVKQGLDRYVAKEIARDSIKQEVPADQIPEQVKTEPGQSWDEFKDANGFNVAFKDKEGTVYAGNQGEIHAELSDRIGVNPDNIAPDGYGFIDKKGNYYNEKDLLPLYKSVNETQIGMGAKAQAGAYEGPAGPEGKVQEPQPQERGWVQTALKNEGMAREAKDLINEIASTDPIDYYVKHHKDSMDLADRRITKSVDEAEKYALSDAPFSAEKGATFLRLIEKAQMEGDFQKEVMLMENYGAQKTEAGQFIEIQRAVLWSTATPQGFMKWVEKQFDTVNAGRGETKLGRFWFGKKIDLTSEDKTFIMQEMTKIHGMEAGPEKTQAFMGLLDSVAGKIPPSINEMVDAFRYQNMLAGFRTQERNIGTNMMNMLFTRPAVLGTRATIDLAGSVLFGKEREAYFRDVPLYYRNAINSIPTGIEAFRQAWKMEVRMEKPEILGTETAHNAFEQARQKNLPYILTPVTRFMEASDKFNQAMIASAEYNVNMSHGMPEAEAMAKAESTAKQYLFRETIQDPSYFSKLLNDLGEMIVKGRKLPTVGKPLSWIVPFIRTPINVGSLMVEMSPLGAIRKPSGWTAEAGARVLAGSMVTAMGAYFAMTGETTWVAPSEEKSKQWFYATGRKPLSIKLGDKWVPLWYMGPFALAFGLPAAIKHYFEESKQSLTDSHFEELGRLAGGMARFLASQTSVQSIGTFFQMLDGDINASFSQVGASMVGQMLAGKALVAQINGLLDPIWRKPEGFVETLMKDIPFLSQELTARTEPFGEMSSKQWFNTFLPYDIGPEKPEYAALYPMFQTEERAQYLENKIGKLLQEIGKGEKDPEAGVKELERMMEAMPRVINPLMKE